MSTVDMSEFITRIRMSPEIKNYFEASARMRAVSVQGLIRSMVYIIGRDHLVASITDDENLRSVDTVELRGKLDKERTFDGERPAPGRPRPPKDKLFDAVSTKPVTKSRVGSAPTRTNRAPTLGFRKYTAKTKSELAAELAEAVRNTAAMPVE